MKKHLLCLALLALFAGEGFAQVLLYATSFEAAFSSEARFEDIEAVSKAGASVINASTSEVAFKIPVQSFKFANGLMQEHFNENYLESDKYPNATFKGKIMGGADLTKKGTYRVTVNGQLSIHGVTRERMVAGVVVVKDGQITITSSFAVPVADHHIDIPNDKISNISQDIRVTVKAVYEPNN